MPARRRSREDNVGLDIEIAARDGSLARKQRSFLPITGFKRRVVAFYNS
jgi:hypothetical protein